MTEWLGDGLKGHSLRATLQLYLFGLALLGLAALLTEFLFGGETSFAVTPVLVVILVGIEYAIYARARVRGGRESLEAKTDDSRLIWSIIGRLSSEDQGHRYEAVRFFATTGDGRAVGALIEALSDEAPAIRSGAAEALGRIGDPQAIEPLAAALKDTAACSDAALALGRIGGQRAARLLEEALREEDAALRYWVVRALATMGYNPRKIVDLLLAEDVAKRVQKRA